MSARPLDRLTLLPGLVWQLASTRVGSLHVRVLDQREAELEDAPAHRLWTSGDGRPLEVELLDAEPRRATPLTPRERVVVGPGRTLRIEAATTVARLITDRPRALYELCSGPVSAQRWVYDAASLQPLFTMTAARGVSQLVYALATVRDLAPPEALAPVLELARDHAAHFVRFAAIEAALAIAPARRAELLRTFADDPHPEVAAAVRELRSFTDRSVPPPEIRLPDPVVASPGRSRIVEVEDTDEVIALAEFCRHVEQRVDLTSLDAIRDVAPMLRRLANDRRLLTDVLIDRLGSWDSRDPIHAYDQDACILHSGDRFTVRAVVWRPPEHDPELDDRQRREAPYELVHNHNFALLTVGYLGGGYMTDVYHVEPDSYLGYPGESVALELVERTTLPRGRVMFYRPFEDVHRQYQPEQLSISLNLMVLLPEWERSQQYFDTTAGVISNNGGILAANCLFIAALLDALPTGAAIDQLRAIARSHEFAELRRFAYERLAERLPDECEPLRVAARDDPAALVRAVELPARRRSSGKRFRWPRE